MRYDAAMQIHRAGLLAAALTGACGASAGRPATPAAPPAPPSLALTAFVAPVQLVTDGESQRSAVIVPLGGEAGSAREDARVIGTASARGGTWSLRQLREVEASPAAITLLADEPCEARITSAVEAYAAFSPDAEAAVETPPTDGRVLVAYYEGCGEGVFDFAAGGGAVELLPIHEEEMQPASRELRAAIADRRARHVRSFALRAPGTFAVYSDERTWIVRDGQIVSTSELGPYAQVVVGEQVFLLCAGAAEPYVVALESLHPPE